MLFLYSFSVFRKERIQRICVCVCIYIHPTSAPRNDSSPRIPFCAFLNHRTSKTTKQNLDKRQEKGELQKSLKIKGTRSHPPTPPSPNGVTQTPPPPRTPFHRSSPLTPHPPSLSYLPSRPPVLAHYTHLSFFFFSSSFSLINTSEGNTLE